MAREAGMPSGRSGGAGTPALGECGPASPCEEPARGQAHLGRSPRPRPSPTPSVFKEAAVRVQRGGGGTAQQEARLLQEERRPVGSRE